MSGNMTVRPPILMDADLHDMLCIFAAIGYDCLDEKNTDHLLSTYPRTYKLARNLFPLMNLSSGIRMSGYLQAQPSIAPFFRIKSSKGTTEG